MNRAYFTELIMISFLLVLYGCSENSVAPDNNEEVGDINATISIQTGVKRTFVGESIIYKSEISNNSNGTQLHQRWYTEPVNIAEIDSLGEATILDIGKASVIAKLYDERQNLVASDTVELYSEAKKTLQAEGIIQEFTIKNPEKGIFAGSSGAMNIYFSNDLGESWEPIDNSFPNSEIRKITRNRSDLNFILSTYRELNSCCNAEKYTGVLLSEDNGATWSEITHPYTPKSGEIFYSFSDIAFAPDDVETLYILTQVNSDTGGTRLYKSTDLGQSWHILKTFERGSSESPNLFIDNDHNLYVGIAGAVANGGGYVSQDRGETWDVWPRDETERLLHVDQNGKLYGRNFAGNSTSTNQQIVYSNDKSQTWNVLIEDDSYNLVHIDTFESDNLALLMLNDTNAGHKIKISFDGGNVWQEYNLSFNDRRTFNRPSKIKILDVKDGTIELLCFWGNPSYGDREEGEVWKLKIFLNL